MIKRIPSLDTYESIIELPQPRDLLSLNILLQSGAPFDLNDRHPELYPQVLKYWNQRQIEVASDPETKSKLQKALTEDNLQELSKLIRNIGGVSPLTRVSGAELTGNSLCLSVCGTNYMDFCGTNIQATVNPIFRANLLEAAITEGWDLNNYFANPLATCAAVYGFEKENDPSSAYVLVGIRNSNMMIYPSVPHVFGGMVKFSPDRTSVSLDGNLTRELTEEIGLVAGEYQPPQFAALIRQAPSRIPEAVNLVKINLPFVELHRRWQERARDKFEHKRITPYQIAEVPEFLERYGSGMVPSGAFALAYLYNFLRN